TLEANKIISYVFGRRPCRFSFGHKYAQSEYKWPMTKTWPTCQVKECPGGNGYDQRCPYQD
ncbi:MAG TPA: hypothetical protein VK602_17135, partial [Phyllobacterium sp.]|nr:hypothetical protein [Phyllobacterium sp.]